MEGQYLALGDGYGNWSLIGAGTRKHYQYAPPEQFMPVENAERFPLALDDDSQVAMIADMDGRPAHSFPRMLLNDQWVPYEQSGVQHFTELPTAGEVSHTELLRET